MVGHHVREAAQHCPEHWQFMFATRADCDLDDAGAVDAYFAKHRFDAILHLAANVGGLYKNMNQNCTMFSDNMRMNLNVLDACIKYKVKRGLFILSSCVFPGYASTFPMTEDDLHAGVPHKSNEGYSYAKRMLEVYVRLARQEHGFQYTCVTPVNLYGPYDNFALPDAHVIPALMRRFADSMDAGDKYHQRFVVYGSGDPLRQFLYAPDLVRMLFFLLALNDAPPHVICCNDNETTIGTMAHTLVDVMDIPSYNLVFDTRKADGCLRKTVSNVLLKKMGFDTSTCVSLEDGLAQTWAWYHANPTMLRI